MKCTSHLFQEINKYIASLDVDSISANRKVMLEPMIDFIRNKSSANEDIRIQFICTHNSRRSHFTQIWAQTMASYFGINRIFSYSGGTECTSLFLKVAETIKNIGFDVNVISPGSNPVYSINYTDNTHPVIGFSKTIDNHFNPTSAFLAVMTCSQADEACPFVAGAEQRISLPFDDPKIFDDTNQQDEKYNECSRQIATEMYFVFKSIKHS